jgi:hypothetical protein
MQDRPERFLRGDVIETRHLVRRQRQPGNGVFSVAVLDLDDPLEIRIGGIFGQFPGDPGALVDPTEKPFQGRNDAVRALVFLENDLSVFLDFLIGLTVINDDKIAGHVVSILLVDRACQTHE